MPYLMALSGHWQNAYILRRGIFNGNIEDDSHLNCEYPPAATFPQLVDINPWLKCFCVFFSDKNVLYMPHRNNT